MRSLLAPVRQRQEYAYEPSAGNSPANPVYLKAWVDGEMCGRSDVTLTLQ